MTNLNDSALPIDSMRGPQVSVLDFFVPGFSGLFAILEQLLAGRLNSYTGVFCVFGVLSFLTKYAYGYLEELVETHLSSTVHVTYSNEAFNMLRHWISSQPFARQVRSSLVSVDASGRWVPTSTHPNGDKKKALSYSPWNGSFVFWYKNQPLLLHSTQKELRFHVEEQISISCLGRSPTVLKELLNECRAEYLKLIQDKTSVFENEGGDWRKTRSRAIRPMSTVIMDEGEKTALLQDIQAFLDPQAQAWYSKRGIPYRRGYLLYGPPGTGKSSLSLSVAGARSRYRVGQGKCRGILTVA